MITHARSDGARDDVLQTITHGESRRDILSVYTTFPYEVKCSELIKLRVGGGQRGEVVHLVDPNAPRIAAKRATPTAAHKKVDGGNPPVLGG